MIFWFFNRERKKPLQKPWPQNPREQRMGQRFKNNPSVRRRKRKY